MRRLYSTFAGGPPGGGLLLLRVVLGANLLLNGIVALIHTDGLWAAVDPLFSGALGLLLIAGLWTPIAGMVAAILSFSHGATGAIGASQALLLGAIGVALALLGPGAWSIDARLFGWTQIDIPQRKPRTRPPN